jgi:2-polyprenyl-3-methyl-5-hydroxy-6-metoxy-1,4-benzoquinol methylase
MDRKTLIHETKIKLADSEMRFTLAKRDLRTVRRNFASLQEALKTTEEHFYRIRNELKLIRRKLLYLENPSDLYVEEFFSKRHKSMMGWEIKLGKSLIESFEIKSIVDFGCGLGAYLEGALLAGADKVLGFDIMYDLAIKYTSDRIKPFLKYGNVGEPISCGKFDCVLSIETAEHLAEEEADDFVSNLINASKKIIVLSASNAGGRYHINRQTRQYWIDKLTARNFIYSQDALDKLFNVWHKNGCPAYIMRNLMVFYEPTAG